jgi:hypothetical protein
MDVRWWWVWGRISKDAITVVSVRMDHRGIQEYQPDDRSKCGVKDKKNEKYASWHRNHTLYRDVTITFSCSWRNTIWYTQENSPLGKVQSRKSN